MTRGRKPRAAEVADAIDSSLDQPKIEGAVAAMRDHAQENLLELLDLAGDIKAIQMADLTANFLRASQVRLFQRVRESKKINNLPIRMQDGRVATCDSIREACPLLFGRSYDTMLREEESFALLGEQAYDVATRLGLNRSALRAARALPPEKLEMVRIAIASGSTKSEVLSVIEDLAIKVEEATQEAAEAKADLEAKDHLLAEKNKRIDQLKAAQKRMRAGELGAGRDPPHRHGRVRAGGLFAAAAGGLRARSIPAGAGAAEHRPAGGAAVHGRDAAVLKYEIDFAFGAQKCQIGTLRGRWPSEVLV